MLYEGTTYFQLLTALVGVLDALSLPMDGAASPLFLCADGSSVALSDVCNGRPQCPDLSDETGKLCWRILCPVGTYRCTYGACVTQVARCNGTTECADGSDEVRCDDDTRQIFCSETQYRCWDNRCIPLSQLCNGYPDCLDGSDEAEGICREYICPDEAYRCLYGGCVYRDVLCDGVKDCIDGTDEHTNLCIDPADYVCRFASEGEFRCNDGVTRCIDSSRVCDGLRDCNDVADESEELCTFRDCPDGWFRCAYGACIRSELLCNRKADCYDWSDEGEEICGISPLPNGACRLPKSTPGTHYAVSGCPVSSGCRPGRIVPEQTKLIYTCDVGEPLEQTTSAIYCQNNRWVPSALPTCPLGNETGEVTCPPVIHVDRAITRCQVKWGPHEGWLPCDKPQPIGAKLLSECPPFYERLEGSPIATCLRDGTWNREPLSCRAVCGTRELSVAALIVHGWPSTTIDALPWHATLYSHENGQWKFFCGGTLIAERAILTAGHCVWKTRAETIRVALGTISQAFEDAMQERTAQLLDVEKVRLQDSYQDYEGNYGSDLAILILKKMAVMNWRVHPACLTAGRSAEETLKAARENGEVGLITGMGLTENDTFSAFLRVASMKIISDKDCRASQSRDFRKYLTYTSFCAGWTNGTSACNGDSGGGLVLRRPNSAIWEVHGVVSISPRRLGTSFCDPSYYTVFTKVPSYDEWIREVIKEIPTAMDTSTASRSPNRDYFELKP